MVSDSATQSGSFSDFDGIDHIEMQFLVYDGALRFTRQVVPHLFRTVDAVQRKNATWNCLFEDIKTFKE